MFSREAWLPPTHFIMLVILTVVLHFALPLATIFPAPLNAVGLLPIGVGVALLALADRAFSGAETTVNSYDTPSELVDTGVFRYTRNPMYLGFVLVLMGMAMLLGSLSSLIAPLLMFLVLDRHFIPYEERTIAAQFPEAFAAYRSRVRRWL